MNEQEALRDATFDDISLAGVDRDLRDIADATAPRPAFLETYLLHLRQAAIEALPSVTANPVRGRTRRIALHRWQAVVGIATAAALILAVGFGAFSWVVRPQPVSAAAVLQKAIAIASDPAAAGIRSYHYKREGISYAPSTISINKGTVTSSAATITLILMDEHWGVFPNRWRTDYRTSAVASGSVSDGMTEWSYSPFGVGTEVQIGALPPGAKTPLFLPIQLPTGAQPGQDATYNAPTGCYRPKLAGEATVAGRAAYVIDLGPYLCPSSFTIYKDGTRVPGPITPPEQQGRHTMWIDKETFFYLKSENYNPDGTLMSRQEVTEIAYNITIPDSVFAYSPPPDVHSTRVTDLRPQPYQIPESAKFPGGGLPPGLVDPSPQKP